MPTQPEWNLLMKDEKFVQSYKAGEKVSAEFVQIMLDQIGLTTHANDSPEEPLVVLDLACGTGIVSSLLYAQLSEDARNSKALKVVCGDISEGMLAYTEKRRLDEGWRNAVVKTVDVQKNGLPDAHFTHVFAALVLFALPDSLAALDETLRIIQPGGTLGFTTWADLTWIPLVRAALDNLSPHLPFPTAQEFLSSLGNGDWASVSWIESQLHERRLTDIHVQAHKKTVSFSVQAFVDVTMLIVANLIRRDWTERQIEEYADKVGPALTEYLEDKAGEAGEVVVEFKAIVATARK
ncbi:S-adenosyl-L-methionine-dependent methyltransferase [Aspergillus crustosus]